MATVEDSPQLGIEERIIEDADLERLLEERQAAKDKVGKAKKVFVGVHEEVKGRIGALELGDTPARIGRFLISQREIDGHSIAFETSPSTRLQISLAKDDGTF